MKLAARALQPGPTQQGSGFDRAFHGAPSKLQTIMPPEWSLRTRFGNVVLLRGRGSDPPRQARRLANLFAMHRLREVADSSNAHRLLELLDELGGDVSWGLDSIQSRAAVEEALRKIETALDMGSLVAFELLPARASGLAAVVAPAPAPKKPQGDAPAAAPAVGDIVVHVKDDKGVDVAGVELALSGPTHGNQITDASGNATFAGVPFGTYNVAAVKAGWTDASGQVQVTSPAFHPLPLVMRTVAAPAVGDIVVHVKDEKGVDVAGVELALSGPTHGNQITDASGNATFAGVPFGTYNVAAVKAGRIDASGQVQVTSLASHPLPLVMRTVKAPLALDGVAEVDKKTKGGLVVRSFDGNQAPRKKITIGAATAGFTGKIVIAADAKVTLFDAANGGVRITLDGNKNAFAAAALPKNLWIEGTTASAAMRDVEVSISADNGPKIDSVKVTVLWVDQPTVALAGKISATNAKIAGYKGWTKSGTDDLGLQEYNNTFGDRMGWGSEASAKVHPSGFNYPGNNLMLERDYDFNDFNDKVVKATGAPSATIPPGNDTGPADARDDDPSPDDTIYDWDAAGLDIPNAPVNTIYRTRNNMKAFASITVEGNSVRCSQVRGYFIDFSQKQTAAPSGSTWQVINPPDVVGDNQAAHGTTKTTWDLK
jgi:hypothetical protein